MLTFIYGLIDPLTGECRYVGKADNVQIRFNRHMQPKQLLSSTHKNSWLKTLVSAGLKPELVIFDKVLKSEWEAHEKWWIAYFRYIGADLTNGTSGGDGCRLLGKQNAMYGRKGEDHPSYGKPRDPETVKKIRKALTGKARVNMSKAAKDRVGAMGKAQTGDLNPFYGKEHSDETKQKWSAKRKGVMPPNARKIRIGADEKYIREWSDLSGVPYGTISARLGKKTWSAYDAIFTPSRPTKRIYKALAEKKKLQDIVLDLAKNS